MQAVAPNTTWVQCSIHREALAAKGMPDRLKYILGMTVKMVNFVKTSYGWVQYSVAWMNKVPRVNCLLLRPRS